MPNHPIFTMPFARVYPLYLQKAQRKNRTQAEVDQIIRWLTGYTPAALQHQLDTQATFETFFAQAPRLHPSRTQIKGTIWVVSVKLRTLVESFSAGRSPAVMPEP